MAVTDELINHYFKGAGVYSDPFRKRSIEIAHALQIHSRKKAPIEILERFRPNEEARHKEFRLANYKPFTNGWYQKILTAIKKIERAEDWSIQYSEEIRDNKFRDYCENNYPEFDSVSNWFFQFGVNPLLDDPNGALLILPRTIGALLMGIRGSASEEFSPVISYIPSSQVLFYSEEMFIYETQEGADLGNGLRDEGDQRKTLYFIDRNTITRAKQVKKRQTIYDRAEFAHNFGEVPAFLLGGTLAEVDPVSGRKLYESFISPVLSHWEEAIELQSDHSLNLRLHLHPDRWQFATMVCPDCNGTGIDRNATGALPMVAGERASATVSRACKGACKGKKYVFYQTPFGVSTITPVKIGDETIMPPTPSAGYIERPIQAIGFLKQEVKDKIFDGLSAVNMEYLGNVLLAQSGTAKAIDRDDSDSFVYTVASWAVNHVLKNVYYFLNEWRYGFIPPVDRAKLLPILRPPKKYNLVTAEVWRDRLGSAKKDGASPATLAYLEIGLARSEYGSESIEFKAVRDSVLLDPLYGKTADEKDLARLNGGCSVLDYIVSTKLAAFIRRASQENKNFFDLDDKTKLAIIYKYAGETQSQSNLSGLGFGAQNPAGAPPAGGDPSANPTDVEAEAKAKLRGLAGGVTALLEIERSVAEGADYDAAIQKIVQIFGYSEEVARTMISKPSEIKTPANPVINPLKP